MEKDRVIALIFYLYEQEIAAMALGQPTEDWHEIREQLKKEIVIPPWDPEEEE